MNKKTIERIKRWLEEDSSLRLIIPGKNNLKKAWLTKKIGISGANQTIGAVRMLDFLLTSWESEE